MDKSKGKQRAYVPAMKKKVIQALGSMQTPYREIAETCHVSLGYISGVMKEYQDNNEEIQALAKKITDAAIVDRKLIDAKASLAQHQYLDAVISGEKQPNPIAITAIKDRSFQQMRLLEDKSTDNIAVKQKIDTIDKIDQLIEMKRAEGKTV